MMTRLSVAALVLLWADASLAACAVTNNFTTGLTAVADDVDQNFTDLRTCVEALQAIDPIISTEIDTSAELRGILTDESGTGALLFAGGALGTPASGVATNLTGIPAAQVTGSMDLGTGTIRGAVSVETTSSTTHTLAAAEGQWILADESGATEIDLPAASAGASFCVYATTAQTVTLDPNGSQIIYLNGTAESAGEAIDATAAVGSIACLISNGTNWYTTSVVGTWTGA